MKPTPRPLDFSVRTLRHRAICSTKHRTAQTAGECEWKRYVYDLSASRAERVGVVWAVIAYCGGRSVEMFATRAEAEKSKKYIDRDACGGSCRNDHKIVRFVWK